MYASKIGLVVKLLKCTQKFKKLDYIKEKCPNIFVVSILTNCTNVLQLANVILQHPFKHASNMESTI